jgi:hypothetical protein
MRNNAATRTGSAVPIPILDKGMFQCRGLNAIDDETKHPKQPDNLSKGENKRAKRSTPEPHIGAVCERKIPPLHWL